jgi:tetratricopeptide (TPR) repeat protein
MKKTEGTRRLSGGDRWPGCCLLLCLAIAAFPNAHSVGQSASSPEGQRYSQLMARAQHLVEVKDYRQAAQTYEEIVRIAPDSFPALNDLGVLYARLGKYPQAAATYERALRLQPRSFPLLVNLGLAYFKAGDFKSAIRPLGEAAAIRPDNFQACTLLGVSYYRVKDYARASTEFERLVARQPDNSTLQYLLAESYLWSGQDRKLLSYFQQVLQQSPNSVTVHMLLGEADDGLDRTEEAIKEFKAATALDPKRPDVNFGLGYLYWKDHQYNQAAAAFEREIQARGDVAKSDAFLGDIALKEGKPRQARPLIEQALHLFGGIRIAHYDLGVLDAQSKDYARAEEELQVAIRLDPFQADAHYRLAEVYRAEGKRQLARQQLKQVKEIQQQKERKLFREISGGSR